jgi:hypothetical protein
MPHRLDHVIDKLFTSDADRALARAWAAKLDADGLGNRTEALIREAASTAKRIDGSEMSKEQALDYLSDFAKTIGVPEHQVASSVSWLAEGEPGPGAAPSDSEIERRMARQEADKIEEVMRSDPQRYWRSQDMQNKYRDALERSIAPPLAPVEQGGQPVVSGTPTAPADTSLTTGTAPAGVPAAAAASNPQDPAKSPAGV